MKKLKTLIVSLVAALTMSFAFGAVASAEEATVYVTVILNGQPLQIPDPMPKAQIISSKTMVPFRPAALALGIDIKFDDATKVISFVKDGKAVSHKMFTNYTTINGVTNMCEAPSQNKDGYTLMPITMLLNAIDAEYTWVDSTKSLFINTNTNAKIMSMSTNLKSVDSGTEVKVTAIASANTQRVKFIENSTAILAEVTTSQTNNDGTKSFTYTWKPINKETTGFKNIKAVAGTETAYSEANDLTKSESIVVNALLQPVINTVDLRETSIVAGNLVTVYVYTNEAVEKIKMSNNVTTTVEEVSNFTTTKGERRFILTMKLTKSGSTTLTIEGAGVDGYQKDLTKTKTVSVKEESKYSFDEVKIDKVALQAESVRPGTTTKIKVVTTSAVTQVTIIDADAAILGTLNTPTSKDDDANERTWEYSIYIPTESSGTTFIYYANARGGANTDEMRFSIKSDVNAVDTALAIKDIAYEKTVKVGRVSTVTLTTSYSTQKIEVVSDDTDKVIYTSRNEDTNSVGSDYKKWKFDLDINTEGRNRYYVYVYDSFGNDKNERIDISGTSDTSTSSKLIDSFEVDKDEYYYNDYVYLTVWTTKDVDSVTVKDYDNLQIEKQTSPRTSSGYYTWDFKFKATSNKTGRNYYTIEASNRNYDDSKEFSVYMR